MGELEKKIAKGLHLSIKSKDGLRTSTLRMVIASIQNLAIEKKTLELDDGEVLKIITKQVKQHQDSIESFEKGNRPDLVEKETKELEILNAYLPLKFDEAKITEIVKKVISQIGAASKSDFGKVMKLSMEEIKSQADGKLVSSIVQKLLA